MAGPGPSPDSTGIVRVTLVYGDTLTQRWLALDHPQIVQGCQGIFGVRGHFDTEVAGPGPSPDSTGMVRVTLVYGDTLTQR